MNKKIILILIISVVLLSGCTNSKSNVPQSISTITTQALYPINIGGKFGFLDANGKLVVQPKYDVGGDFNDGLAIILLNGKWGFIDSSGKEAIPPQYINQPMDFKNGLSRVRDNNGKAIYFNTQGKIIWQEK